jgi:hypothetical protein
MSQDYYFAAVYGDWSGYNVSLLEVNNIDRPTKIRLLEAQTVCEFSHQGVIDTICSLADGSGKLALERENQPSLLNLHPQFKGVVMNENKGLAEDLRRFAEL